MKIGIVGHGKEKFTPDTETIAKSHINSLIDRLNPESVCSGRSPMGGIDIWAEEITNEHKIHFQPFPAEVPYWTDTYNRPPKIGYKDRNIQIANYSDLVICIVVAKLPDGYKGMVFNDCYHCANHRIPYVKHVKSGGCWTAWRCKQHEWIVI